MTNLTHDISFWLMYVAATLAVFVIVERLIFFTTNARTAKRLFELSGEASPAAVQQQATQIPGVAAELVATLAKARSEHRGADLEAAGDAALIAAHKKLQRHLWLLDTIVTAAPLLGLLGTILGIVDTFYSLANSGMSDPAGVSSGIGTALYATALGISIALIGLVFFNHFQDRVERISDSLKVLVLRMGMGV